MNQSKLEMLQLHQEFIKSLAERGPTAANSVLTTENMKNASDRASLSLAV